MFETKTNMSSKIYSPLPMTIEILLNPLKERGRSVAQCVEIFRKLTVGLNLFLLGICLIGITFGQATGVNSPVRGFQPGGSYALSDIENISTQNGNLMMHIPLVSLPPARGGISAQVGLYYNSKIWEAYSEMGVDIDNNPALYQSLRSSPDGGWRFGMDYGLRLITGDEYQLGGTCYDCPPESSCSEPNWALYYIYQLQIVGPDGGSHILHPQAQPEFQGRTRLRPDGYLHTCGAPYDTPVTTGSISYYTSDGSFMRLEIDHDSDTNWSNNPWTLYLADGGHVTGGGGLPQRIYDRNDNYLEVHHNMTYNGHQASEIVDQLGRAIVIESTGTGTTYVYQRGVNDAEIKWTIEWEALEVYRGFFGTDYPAGSSQEYQSVSGNPPSITSITLPEQAGSQTFEFTYNNSLSTGDGWGELRSIKLPSGATATYNYSADGHDSTNTVIGYKEVLLNFPTQKTLTYNSEYDGVSTPVTETWNYSRVSGALMIVDPSGGVQRDKYTSSASFTGISSSPYRIEYPDGTIVERIFANNLPQVLYPNQSPIVIDEEVNRYIKTEFHTIPDASGNPVKTAIKDYSYDKNGNLTQLKEYDWVPYSSIPRTVYGIPSGIPSATLKKTTNSNYYYQTANASASPTSDGNVYNKPGAPVLLKAAQATEILDGSNAPVARIEMVYDNSSSPTHGNLTESKAWDTFKGGSARSYSNPLTGTNAVIISATYNSYGMPLTFTDANGNLTSITYGNVAGPVGNVTSLYPTQTVSADGTAIERTSTAVYDYYTGLVTSSTDEDNDLTNSVEYDDLGRPTKVRTAAGTALESWTRTEYDDVARRVIVRGDLETVGDGKKVAVQHYDQLGRVRLSRSLENPWEDPTNETHGIKVETRYQTGNPNSYQLTSNPFRAATATAATNEPTMGWTRSKSWNTGRRAETETFSGSALPAPWGSNSASTGVVVTESDANATTVTDQASKVRRSITNGLGQLVRVDEPTGSGLGTVGSPNQATSYAYDTLNNLTTVTQGSQTRTFTYSTMSRLLSAANPESGTINYVYDSNGNLTTKTDARSIVTTYTYDALNRVTDRDYSDSTPDVDYTYGTSTGKIGRLTKVQSSVSATEYLTFDILGRVTSHKQATDSNDYTTGYTYNLSGALIEETYPSGRVVKNTLDTDGALSQVQSKRSGDTYRNYTNSFNYNAAGAVTSMKLGNNRWETTTFNSRLQPTQIGLGLGTATPNILKLDYSYGTTANNGNVLSHTITVPGLANPFVQSYTYDELNRISTATETNNSVQTWKQAFTYDRYGNRNFDEANTTTLPKNCGTTPNFTVCAADKKIVNPSVNTANNRLSTSDDYAFDSSGNTTEDAEGRTFVYDAENKQIEVIDNSVTIGEYSYDDDGKRIKKVVPATGETTIFIYDAAGKLIQEYSTIVETGGNAKTVYTTNDSLGSPRINTDATGNVVARHDYHPFGEEIATAQRTGGVGYAADTIRKQFTGYERDDETGLDFAQARYYVTSLGRFATTDPELLSMEIAMPQSFNRYSYTINNPLVFVDPDGELWVRNDKREYGRTQEFLWVDQCGEGQTCYEAIAATSVSGVTVYGSNDFKDITEFKANKDGMIDVQALSQHHNAEFVVASGQNVPEEYLATGAASALFNVAKYYSEQYVNDDKLVFTAGAASNGKPGNCGGKPCHSGHQGNDIDLRYMDSNGQPIKGDSAYQSADIGRTNFLVEVFKDNGRPVSYTGDDSRFGRPDDSPKSRDSTERVHRHHLHVGVSKPKKK